MRDCDPSGLRTTVLNASYLLRHRYSPEIKWGPPVAFQQLKLQESHQLGLSSTYPYVGWSGLEGPPCRCLQRDSAGHNEVNTGCAVIEPS